MDREGDKVRKLVWTRKEGQDPDGGLNAKGRAAYNRANDATFDLGKEFREDLLSAIRLGKISQKRAQEILSASRLSKEDIKMLRTGRYLRYEPSPQQIKLAKELGNENRIRDARQAERAAATNIPLR